MVADATQEWKAIDGECPICEHKGWCQISGDDAVCMCRGQPVGAYATRLDSNGAEYHLHRLTPPDGEAPITADQPTNATALADVETRHAVYTAVLDELGLSPAHMDSLVNRGLTPEEIARRQYRTVPLRVQTKLPATLGERFGVATLLSIPGFYVSKGDVVRLGTSPGLLVPVRDAEHRILGLMVRPDELLRGAKYLWVSSKKHGGPGPGAPSHVPLGVDGPVETIRLTEGALKADVATVLSGVPTIGVPGAANWKSCLPIIAALGCRTVRLAYDADAWTNPTVGRALGACCEALLADGITIEVERWDPAAGKGIDDVLAAGGTVEVVTGEDANTLD